MFGLLTLLLQATPLAPCGGSGVGVEVKGLPPAAVEAFVEDLAAESLPKGLEPCAGAVADQLVLEVGVEVARLSARIGGNVSERTLAFRSGDEPLVLAVLAGELLRELAALPRRPPPAPVAPVAAAVPSVVVVGVSAASTGSLAGDWFFGPEVFVSFRHERWGVHGSAGGQWAPQRTSMSGAVWSLAVLGALRATRVVFERGAFSLELQVGVRGGAVRGASLVVVAWEPLFAFEGGAGAGFDVGPFRLGATALLGATARGVRWLDGTKLSGGLSGLMASLSLGAGWRW